MVDFSAIVADRCEPAIVRQVNDARGSANGQIALIARFGPPDFTDPKCNGAILGLFLNELTPKSDAGRLASALGATPSNWRDLHPDAKKKATALFGSVALKDDVLALTVFKSVRALRMDIRPTLSKRFKPDRRAKRSPADDPTLEYYLYLWSMGDRDAPSRAATLTNTARDAETAVAYLTEIAFSGVPDVEKLLRAFYDDTRVATSLTGNRTTVGGSARELANIPK